MTSTTALPPLSVSSTPDVDSQYQAWRAIQDATGVQRSIDASPAPLLRALFPLVAEVSEYHRAAQDTISSKLTGCVGELKAVLPSLMRYMETNEHTARELELEGCVRLASNKRSVALAQKLLVHRITNLVGGTLIWVPNPPFLHPARPSEASSHLSPSSSGRSSPVSVTREGHSQCSFPSSTESVGIGGGENMHRAQTKRGAENLFCGQKSAPNDTQDMQLSFSGDTETETQTQA